MRAGRRCRIVQGAGRYFSVCFHTMPANVKSSSPSLGQSMLRRVLLVAGGASLLFGLLFLALYRDQLERERAATSDRITCVSDLQSNTRNQCIT